MTPTYVSAANFVKGCASAEAAINISSARQSWANPKEWIRDKEDGRTGFATDYDIETTMALDGEINTAASTGAFGAAWAVAMTIANAVDGFGVTTGGWFLEDVELSSDRGSLQTASCNAIRIPGLVASE